MIEIWKDIKGYEGLYQVSNLGNIKNVKRNKPVRHSVHKRTNYCHLTLRENKKMVNHSVHRLVAAAFIPNPDNLPQVNHIDGNKQNNNLPNLEWCTTSYNQKHSFKLGLSKNKKGSESHNAKPIVMKTLDGRELKRFGAAVEAAKETGINVHCINKNLKGHHKTAYGYVFEYIKTA